MSELRFTEDHEWLRAEDRRQRHRGYHRFRTERAG